MHKILRNQLHFPTERFQTFGDLQPWPWKPSKLATVSLPSSLPSSVFPAPLLGDTWPIPEVLWNLWFFLFVGNIWFVSRTLAST